VEVSIDAFRDTTFKGEVIEISSAGTTYRPGTPDEVTNFEVKIEVTEWVERLKPNMSATCKIITEQKSDVLKVPIQSVVEKEKKAGVFAVRNGMAEWVDIKSGISDEKWMEIEEGVDEGDTVVSGTYKVLSTLKAGDRVEASSVYKGEGEESESD
jgi:HlyD family secretion protein